VSWVIGGRGLWGLLMALVASCVMGNRGAGAVGVTDGISGKLCHG